MKSHFIPQPFPTSPYHDNHFDNHCHKPLHFDVPFRGVVIPPIYIRPHKKGRGHTSIQANVKLALPVEIVFWQCRDYNQVPNNLDPVSFFTA
jgi:hypothetical protein